MTIDQAGLLCAEQLSRQPWLVHTVGAQSSMRIPRPRVLGVDFESDLNYYWLCLAVFVVLAAFVHHLRRTGLGRAMMAVRDNEPAAATLGVSPRRVKLTAFVLAGMIAAFAGYLYGGLLVSFALPRVMDLMLPASLRSSQRRSCLSMHIHPNDES